MSFIRPEPSPQRRLSTALLGVAASLFASCATAPTAPCAEAPVGQHGPGDLGGDTVVATLGERRITLGELDRALADDLSHARLVYDETVYDARERQLSELTERLALEREAERREFPSVDALIAAEVTAKVAHPSRAEVEATYRAHQEELDGQPLDEVADYIAEYLEKKAAAERYEVFVAELKRQQGLAVTLDPPRVAVAATGPSQGPTDAPVTIIMFSDYECPYCHRGLETIREVLARYPRDVRFVYRHFPLASHPHAHLAAEAAVCAEEQGHFWQLHEAMVATEDELERPVIEALAQRAGLDPGRLATCLDGGGASARVDADQRAGMMAAVQGTPAFFINGIRIEGAHPASDFVTIIDRELDRLRVRK